MDSEWGSSSHTSLELVNLKWKDYLCENGPIVDPRGTGAHSDCHSNSFQADLWYFKCFNYSVQDKWLWNWLSRYLLDF